MNDVIDITGLQPEIESFWQHMHRTKDVPHLSGCRYEETIDFLHLNDYIIPGAAVLEVGVGLGYVTKGLYEAKMNVSALDISDEALKEVEHYCDKNVYNAMDLIYSTENILPTDHFDVIICNNVVQHIPTNDLKDELPWLIDSLKPDSGVFAVEFVSNDKEEDMGEEPTMSAVENGGLCRSPVFFKEFLNCSNWKNSKFELKFKPVVNDIVDKGIVKGHHVFHVRKRRITKRRITI